MKTPLRDTLRSVNNNVEFRISSIKDVTITHQSFLPPQQKLQKTKKPRSKTKHTPKNKAPIEDFEQAMEFLDHFHGYASRSLDVIYESPIDYAERNENDATTKSLEAHPSPDSSPQMRRTKTCPVFSEEREEFSKPRQRGWPLDMMARNVHNTDGDEFPSWGFYDEEEDPPANEEAPVPIRTTTTTCSHKLCNYKIFSAGMRTK